jgi:hypothetical protein
MARRPRHHPRPGPHAAIRSGPSRGSRRGTSLRTCSLSNSGAWPRRFFGIRIGPGTLAVEHPIASARQGSAAGSLQIDRLLAGDLALHDAPPVLRLAQGLECLGLIDTVAPAPGRETGVVRGPGFLPAWQHLATPNRAKKCPLRLGLVSNTLKGLERVKGIEPSS